jgi:hypothetical protein
MACNWCSASIRRNESRLYGAGRNRRPFDPGGRCACDSRSLHASGDVYTFGNDGLGILRRFRGCLESLPARSACPACPRESVDISGIYTRLHKWPTPLILTIRFLGSSFRVFCRKLASLKARPIFFPRSWLSCKFLSCNNHVACERHRSTDETLHKWRALLILTIHILMPQKRLATTAAGRGLDYKERRAAVASKDPFSPLPRLMAR